MAVQPTARSSKGPLGAGLRPAVALVDGNMMAKQAYHTTGDLISEDGINTGVLHGFVGMLRGLLWNFPSMDQIVILWDSYPSWRATEFPYYKAARGARGPSTDPSGEDTWEGQKELLRNVLPLLGIHQISAKAMEADDLAYILPTSGICGDRHAILVSNDRDWLQLVSPDRYVYRSAKKDMVTPENFEDVTKYGKPEFVVELKALMGDGDEFPGAPGIGEKSALAYLQNDDLQMFRLRKIEEWLKTKQYQDNLILASIPHCVTRYSGEMSIRHGSLNEKVAFAKFRDLAFYSLIERWSDSWSTFSRLKPLG